jgi:hypothetical protein
MHNLPSRQARRRDEPSGLSSNWPPDALTVLTQKQNLGNWGGAGVKVNDVVIKCVGITGPSCCMVKTQPYRKRDNTP